MAAASSSPVVAHTEVALLLPGGLREVVLRSAAEIVVEHGARSRRFLHIHTEDERKARIAALVDVSDAERRAHERHLAELQWARGVLWREPRIRHFLRYEQHLVWPTHKQVSAVAAVARQLLLLEESDSEAAQQRAGEVTRAAELVSREATQPGLHVLTESKLPGLAVVYEVRQTRKRERDAAAATMPSELARLDNAQVAPTALIAELKEVVYAATDVLGLQLAVAPLSRLVTFLQVPNEETGADAQVTPVVVRQRWKMLLEQHRASADYQSLFADVVEGCRGWGMTEAVLAREVQTSVAEGRSVCLRTGVHASVLHRTELHLLLITRPRKLEAITAAEQRAVLAALPSRQWSQFVEEGMLRIVQVPGGAITAALLEPVLRRLCLSPALRDTPLTACCSFSQPIVVSEELRLVTVTAAFNPLVVLHGSRVEGGFEGEADYHTALQRDRDRLVEEKMYDKQRREYTEATARGPVKGGAASPTASAHTSNNVSSPVAPPSEATAMLFKRSLVSVLTLAPMSKAELRHHPSLQRFRDDGSIETLLPAKLKEVAEFKARKYQLRS